MKDKDFVNIVLDKLFERFTNLLECFYVYDTYSNTHFFKLPSKEIYNSMKFNSFDAEISLKAYDQNLNASICFITEDIPLNYLNFEEKRNPYLVRDEALSSFTTLGSINLNDLIYSFNFESSVNIFSHSNDIQVFQEEETFPLAA